ncbi:MAG: hypothetical protein RXR82_07615 [Nitrososphaeria archaeon]
MAGAGPDKRCDAARRFTTRTGLLDLVTIPIETLPRRAPAARHSDQYPALEGEVCSFNITGWPIPREDPLASAISGLEDPLGLTEREISRWSDGLDIPHHPPGMAAPY